MLGRELLADAGEGLATRPIPRGPGGAETGLVVICSAGSALPLAWGSTSSRFTGIPNETRCRRRIRDRVQFGGWGVS